MKKGKKNLLVILVVIIGLLLAPNPFTLHTHAKTNDTIMNYTIKKGDTFYWLGLRFNSSIEDISSMNPKEDPLNLLIGSKIKLPIGPGIKVHPVKKGDTLGNLASNYNSTVTLIASQNKIGNRDMIYPGDILAIPEIPNLESFPINEFADKFMQDFGKDIGLYQPNIRIEDGLLKIDNVVTNLPLNIYLTEKVEKTLKLFGYKIARGHTMENVECDFRLCGGTKLYTIEKIQK